MATEQITTKDRVLASAGEVFARKGYRDATVAEICERAGANVASVNYYFGDKESLYDAVWRHAFTVSAELYPIETGAEETASPEDQLRLLVKALVGRVLDPGPAGYYARIQIREMVEPTPALEHIVHDVVVPQRKVLLTIVDRLLEGHAPEHIVHLCAYTVASQCLFLGVSQPVRNQLVRERAFAEPDIDAFADYIHHTSLAGIAEMRERYRT